MTTRHIITHLMGKTDKNLSTLQKVGVTATLTGSNRLQNDTNFIGSFVDILRWSLRQLFYFRARTDEDLSRVVFLTEFCCACAFCWLPVFTPSLFLYFATIYGEYNFQSTGWCAPNAGWHVCSRAYIFIAVILILVLVLVLARPVLDKSYSLI